jgi:hypothetical protein
MPSIKGRRNVYENSLVHDQIEDLGDAVRDFCHLFFDSLNLLFHLHHSVVGGFVGFFHLGLDFSNFS